MKIKIADNGFMLSQKSAFAGCDNINLAPKDFEWELADVREARFVTDSLIKDAEGPGQVAWLLEPFFLHPENYVAAMSKPFDAVLTHSEYFADNLGWLWYPHGGSLIDTHRWGLHGKKKGISILLSAKDTMLGHKLRHEIVERYRNLLDVYGLDAHVHPLEAYAEYKYSVVVENERTPGYFTERLIDCLSVGTIPIYWGCPNIDDFFTPGTIIQFDDIDQVGYFLNYPENLHHVGSLQRAGTISEAKDYMICENRIIDSYPYLFDL